MQLTQSFSLSLDNTFMLTWAWMTSPAGECVRNDTIWIWWCWLDLTWPLQFIRPWSHSLATLVLYCDDHMYRCMLHAGFLNDRGWRKPWPNFSRSMTHHDGEGCCLVAAWEMSDIRGPIGGAYAQNFADRCPWSVQRCEWIAIWETSGVYLYP